MCVKSCMVEVAFAIVFSIQHKVYSRVSRVYVVSFISRLQTIPSLIVKNKCFGYKKGFLPKNIVTGSTDIDLSNKKLCKLFEFGTRNSSFMTRDSQAKCLVKWD